MKIKSALTALAAVLALAATVPAQAADGTMGGHIPSGFYAGGFGGYAWNDVNGADWGVFGGYQLTDTFPHNDFIDLNGALEGTFGWSNAHDTRFVGATATQFDKKYDWGLSFRPGLTFISDHAPLGLHPYGIIGYRQADFKSSTTGTGIHNGFDLGIGTELVAYQNFGIRADYDHVFYQAKNGLDPDEDSIRGGVVYHF